MMDTMWVSEVKRVIKESVHAIPTPPFAGS